MILAQNIQHSKTETKKKISFKIVSESIWGETNWGWQFCEENKNSFCNVEFNNMETFILKPFNI